MVQWINYNRPFSFANRSPGPCSHNDRLLPLVVLARTYEAIAPTKLFLMTPFPPHRHSFRSGLSKPWYIICKKKHGVCTTLDVYYPVSNQDLCAISLSSLHRNLSFQLLSSNIIYNLQNLILNKTFRLQCAENIFDFLVHLIKYIK